MAARKYEVTIAIEMDPESDVEDAEVFGAAVIDMLNMGVRGKQMHPYRPSVVRVREDFGEEPDES